ncbi:Oligopeptide transport ATP-binding protein OppD [subsurface metagenome]
MTKERILGIHNLSVVVPEEQGHPEISILNGINLYLKKAEHVGIIGGSGSGKSVLMNAIIKSLHEPLVIKSGEVVLGSENILTMKHDQLNNKVLGKRIASICPNPNWRLDPIEPVGEQVKNIYLSHFKVKEAEARIRVLELFNMVGIPDATTRYNAFSHELSGGMAQRVLITMALICEPEVLLADEPTGGLDVTIQMQVFDLILRLIREKHRSIIIASRDIGLIYHLCNHIYVLKEGRIVEAGNIKDVIQNPIHPYTCKLIKLSESNYKIRRSQEYMDLLQTTDNKYYKLCEENAAHCKDGYLMFENEHIVRVCK